MFPGEPSHVPPMCVTLCPLLYLAVTNGQLQQLSQTSETSSSISSYSSGPPPGTVNGLGTVTPGPPTRTVDVAISTEDGLRRGWARDRAERAMQTEPATEGLQETRRTVRPPELLRDTAIRGQGSREPPGTHPRRTFSHSPKTALLLALSRPRQPITRSQSDLTVAGRNSAPTAPRPQTLFGTSPLVHPNLLLCSQRRSGRRSRRARGHGGLLPGCTAPRPSSTFSSRVAAPAARAGHPPAPSPPAPSAGHSPNPWGALTGTEVL